jgi:hypothetical protein
MLCSRVGPRQLRRGVLAAGVQDDLLGELAASPRPSQAWRCQMRVEGLTECPADHRREQPSGTAHR